MAEKSDEAKLIVATVFVTFAVLFLNLGILSAAHEAIKVEDGKGESLAAIFGIMILSPVGVSVCIYAALKIWSSK